MQFPSLLRLQGEKNYLMSRMKEKFIKWLFLHLAVLGIFAGFILATIIGAPVGSNELQYFVAAAIVIFFLGIKDDILVLSAAKKFIGQLIAAGIIMKFGGVQITNMHGFLGYN